MNVRQLQTLLVAMLYLMPPCLRAAEDLDSSFGQGMGYVMTAYGQGVVFNALQIQSDGKIVAAGYTQNPNIQAVVIRYNTDGTLDTGFGTGGIVATNIGSITATTEISGLAIQSTGEIVVVGSNADSGVTQTFAARYTAAGALDGTFGTGGIVLNTFSGDASQFNGIVIQTDGDIVAAGTADFSGTVYGLIARFDTAGALDTTFNSTGFVTVVVGNSTEFNAVGLDSSSNIVVSGFNSVGFGEQAITGRYTSTGMLDSTFGTSGFVTTQIGTNTTIGALAFDSSGNILVAGIATLSGFNNFVIIRYTSAGVLDTSFNSGGSATTLIGGSSVSADIAIQADGKILISGYATDSIDFATLARYTSSGALDTTFGDGGIVLLTLGTGSGLAAVVLQTSDGRAVAAGYETDPETSQSTGLVARFNKNNSDFVAITSIVESSTIYTKIPIISGTSSALSAQVKVTINGTVFTTVSTDGSGNWNAGVSPVLLIGTNLIEATSIISGSPVVSDEIEFTVIDTFGEDAVFTFDTTTQSALTGTFADVTLSNNGAIGTWGHTLGTASLTCNKSGTYVISYLGTATEVADAVAFSASLRLVKNGTTIAGSQVVNAVTLDSATITPGSLLLLNSSAIVTLAATDVIKLQAAGSNAQLAPATEGGSSGSSAAVVITRIA